MFNTTGLIAEVSTELVGRNKDFPVTEIELTVGDKPVRYRAAGRDSDRISTLLGGLPAGTLVRVIGRAGNFNQSGDRVYYDVEAVDATIFGNIGTQESKFRLQGALLPLETVDGKKGAFYTGRVGVVDFGRDGHTGYASVDMTLNDNVVDIWNRSVGKFAIVTGNFYGWKTNEGRIYPRLYAEGIEHVVDAPAFLAPYLPGAASSTPVASAVAAPVAVTSLF